MSKTITKSHGGSRAGSARLWVAGPVLGLALALVMLLFPAIASAHAYYVSSNPAAGALLTKAPALVTITFAENVNPQGSDIIVYDAARKQVSAAQANVVTSNLKQMTVPMKGDGDGIYLVEWHTVSADDGAQDIGGFTFTVAASGKADPSAGPATSVATSTAPAAVSSGVPIWLAVVIGVIGLVVGAGGAAVALRRGK